MTDSVDHEISVCCLLLTLPHEVEVTIQTLDSLLHSAGGNLVVLLLVNGGQSAELRARVQLHPQVQLFESLANLGVAGGRAFLAAQDAARHSDIVMLADNDILLPVDYIEPMCQLLTEDHSVGVLGASVVNYKYLSGRIYADNLPEKGVLGEHLPRFTNADVRRYVEQHQSEGMFFHLGVHPDWMSAYFPRLKIIDEYRNRKGRTLEDDVFFSRNTKVLDQFVEGGPSLIGVSNIAGCTQMFRRELYDEIGGVRPEYSPYGYEDVDFCLRAIRAGYRNYTMTNVFSLHGTDDRHQRRRTLMGVWPANRNIAKAYGLLVHYHCPWSRRPFLVNNYLIKLGFDVLAIIWRVYYEVARVAIRTAASLTGFFQAQFLIVKFKIVGDKRKEMTDSPEPHPESSYK